ncbi:trypco2 family protein [Candidatus Entotheonella palauensis]|uniref:Trypsin-co-occurring domain-containing protein n=1 Tax=Candidatus Entotheonella gemina TaxID=1429439 RepID=W4M957_9BACT|nr:trypco2 family protein [Candidatus Entotheonella palauensis]ETX06456.1 MAG: hypothetical protein ETSY2_16970 [Candidatus Entotheonella gemina]
MERISLAQALDDLKHELLIMREANRDREEQYLIEEAEIELSITMEAKRSGAGETTFWVTPSGSDSTVTHSGHKIRLKLKPVSRHATFEIASAKLRASDAARTEWERVNR